MKRSILTVAVAAALIWFTAGTTRLGAQSGTSSPSAGSSSAKVPRTADGHPDLSGVWWRGADVGGRIPGGGSCYWRPARGRGAELRRPRLPACIALRRGQGQDPVR